MIDANVICDSINDYGCRLTTFVVKFPRIILPELNTHRAFSRNSSSSRAIPFDRMVEAVKNDPFVPIKFQKPHKGMQGSEYYDGEDHKSCVSDWLKAMDSAVNSARNFTLPITKQLRNRLLEPFMYQTAIISATDYENFFRLRAHEDAEIHIQDLAYKMLEAYNKSTPKQLYEGEWHIPFGDKVDNRIDNLSKTLNIPKEELVKRVAIARCARVSYINFDGKDDYENDLALFDRLVGSVPKHLSPTEHVAAAISSRKYYGNFKGFLQYRKTIEQENLKDERVR